MSTDPVRIVYVEDDSDNVYVLTRRLARRGYDVTFKEFDGGHQVPPDVAAEALRWISTRR